MSTRAEFLREDVDDDIGNAMFGHSSIPLRVSMKIDITNKVRGQMNYRFVVTGGPGGGKTTILSALAARGYSFAPESARRIIKERLAAGLSPRPDPVSFAHEILSSDIEKYRDIGDCNHPTFFDRGVLDALYMLNTESALTHADTIQYIHDFSYNGVVFLLPPPGKKYRPFAISGWSVDTSNH